MLPSHFASGNSYLSTMARKTGMGCIPPKPLVDQLGDMSLSTRETYNLIRSAKFFSKNKIIELCLKCIKPR